MKDSSTGKYEKWIFDYDKVKLSEKDRDKNISDAVVYQNEDSIFLKKIEAKQQLEKLCIRIRNSLLDKIQFEYKVFQVVVLLH